MPMAGRRVAADVRRRLTWPALVAIAHLLVLALVPSAPAQTANIHYIYDSLNRLVGVVDQQGNMSVYVYDAVGNLLRIDRVDASSISGALGITLVTPNRGQVGTAVQIFGKGFGATPSANAVRFNGTLATVTEAAPNRLLTTVPSGATTGSVTVTVSADTATSPSPFTVGAVIAVTPSTATVWMNGTVQFAATEGGSPTTAVTWAVNGITGGDATIGTISTGGLYTAPAKAPQDTAFTISVTQAEDRSSSASATVIVLQGGMGSATASASAVFVDSPQVNKNLIASVSAALAETPTFHMSAPVTASLGPVITSISPTSAARGATDVSVTITGVGLASATQLSFLAAISGSFAADTNITITNLSASGDGTTATATISVGTSAVLGAHTVQIQAGGGSSTQVGTGTNVFTVNP